MTRIATSVQASASIAREGTVRAALAAGLLGLAILFVVGFAAPAAIHNAAHDSRHAIAFPCH
jgi:cobalt transporter subunit CbtB